MTSHSNRGTLLAIAAFLTVSACNGGPPVWPGSSGPGFDVNAASPVDTTSILKKLKKDVVIGSTVDPTNGDRGPRAISVVKVTYGLTKGQLLVCNFENKARQAGDGTTIDVFDPKPGSSPATFAKSVKIEGCAGDAVTYGDDVYGAGLVSHVLAAFTEKGRLKKTYGAPLKAPFDDLDVACPPTKPHCIYSAEYIFSTDAQTGSIVSFSVNMNGNPHPTQVATGFAVNQASGWSVLGPSGLAYTYPKDTLYIADGVDNTIVAFDHASELLVKDEIVVLPGGKTFKCKYPHTTCGTLVYAGKPLDDPEAMTLLPNGNLVVANTHNGNTLVELTPTGTVLDTKVVDKSKTAGIFGLAATGTNDSNTALFFTDTNSNNLQKLEQ
jgi:hypothetical protein